MLPLSAWFILFLVSVTIVIFVLKTLRNSKTNAPPEPPLLFVLKMVADAVRGNLQEVIKGHQLLQRRYGNVLSFPIFRYFIKPCILINDYKLVKEAFSSSACFARPNSGFTIYYFCDEVRGLGLHHDETKWSEIRQFTFKALKDHGATKTTFDAISAEEASSLVARISHCHANKPVSTDELFSIPMMNVLWTIISGKRFDFNDTEAHRVYKIISKTVVFLALLAVLGNISNKLLIWIRFLEPLQAIRRFFIQHVIASKINFKEGEVNTFTDAFLQKIRETTNPQSMFHGRVGEENLAATVGELIAVGAKSSSVTLQWIMLYLAAHPEKQAILQKEVDTTIGERVPTFDDKKLMPYTKAVMQETMRIATLFPAGVPRQFSEDMSLGGYTICKGTIVASNTITIHNDPGIWGDPEIFRPERFLSSDDSISANHKAFFPFGVGKRACPGEHLAKHNLFIFIVSIVQQFSVSLDKAAKVNLNPRHFSPTLVPAPHKLVFSKRLL